MDEDVVDYNAGASHEEVEANGSAMDPSLFPDPAVGLARRVRANLYNPQQPDLGVLEVDRVVYQIHPDGSPPARAYWLGRKLSKTILGCVRSCTVLTLREGSKWTGPESGEAGGGAIWLVTADTLAVKMMSWPMVQKHMGELGEDGWKEVAAMQWIGQAGTSPHVLDAIDVLRNDEAMYLFMPLGTGSLFETAKTTFERSGAGRFPEPFARGWFRQLLSGVRHLQRSGIAHRDMSLENVIVHKDTRNAMIMDFGMCLRVPFVTDAYSGTRRCLIRPQIRCGKPYYVSPEVYQSRDPFDGYAIDLWACSVMLFIMLVGCQPWDWPVPEDARFVAVAREGRLAEMLVDWGRTISPGAADLLQGMLMEDPRDRLSLAQVEEHAWVCSEEVAGMPAPADEGWRMS